MSRPEELRRVTDNTLHDLVADDALKFRILQKAAETNGRNEMHSFRAIPLLCTVLAALLIIVTALNRLQAVPSSGPGDLISFTAGNDETVDESFFPEHYTPDSVVSIEMDGIGIISDSERCSLLARILEDKASAVNLSVPAGNKLLTISFSDGNSISYQAEEPYLIREDGHCWYCPDIFREFFGLSE